jgi:hypothetical protein
MMEWHVKQETERLSQRCLHGVTDKAFDRTEEIYKLAGTSDKLTRK